MSRILVPLFTVLLASTLSGCGLGETASTSAAIAEAEAASARAAMEKKEQIEQAVDDMQAAADERRRQMEAAAE